MQPKFHTSQLVIYDDTIHEIIEVVSESSAIKYKLLTKAFLTNDQRSNMFAAQEVGYNGRKVDQLITVEEEKLTAFAYKGPKFSFNEWVKFGDGVRENPGIVRFILFANNNYWYGLVDATHPERVEENIRTGYSMRIYSDMHGYNGLADERYMTKY